MQSRSSSRSRFVITLALAMVVSPTAAVSQEPVTVAPPAGDADRDGASASSEVTPARERFGDRTLKLGVRGDDVKRLQRILSRFGFETADDGDFGSATEKNVRRYERWIGWGVNGVVGKEQSDKMSARIERLNAGPSSYKFGERKLEAGSKGRDVGKLQRLLTKLRIDTEADSKYGPGTEKSVRRFERWRDEQVNGIVSQPEAHEIDRLAARGAKRPEKENDASYVFPIRGPYSFGGDGARFGAPRGDRSHRGQDIVAAEGTPLVSVHRGRVAVAQYQAGGAGNYVVIRGEDGSDSVYMHMAEPALVEVGEEVSPGERIGSVGNTGASFGAHLHFELWTQHWYDGGEPYDPLPMLKRWAD